MVCERKKMGKVNLISPLHLCCTRSFSAYLGYISCFFFFFVFLLCMSVHLLGWVECCTVQYNSCYPLNVLRHISRRCVYRWAVDVFTDEPSMCLPDSEETHATVVNNLRLNILKYSSKHQFLKFLVRKNVES